MQVNVAGFRRNIKNLAHNYSDAQIKVREATSNDPWGPSATIMAEVADLTYNVVAFSEIMQMIWKRLNDHGKNWRHVLKALILLEYLIKTGTEKVAQQCKENIFAIQTLKEFQHQEECNDQGIRVRDKAKQLVALLKDDERLKNERTKALKAKERFAQNASGFGSDGSIDGPTHRESPSWRSETDGASGIGGGRTAAGSGAAPLEIEYVRPQTVGEEELQLQLAMAMSREEAEQEEAKRRSDDVRLQLALSQSENDFKQTDAPKKQESHLLDLLDISLGATTISSPADAWGMPRPAAVADPWANNASSSPVDPWQSGAASSAARPAGTASVESWLSRTQSPSSGSSAESAWLQNGITQPTIATANGHQPGIGASSVDPWLTGKPPNAPLDPWLNKPQPSDPWQSPKNTSQVAPPLEARPADPWSLSNMGARPSPIGAQMSPNSDLDEFDVITNRSKSTTNGSSNNNNSSFLDDLDPLSSKKSSPPQQAAPTLQNRTPQSFLGENSALVNLDNLIKPAVPNNGLSGASAFGGTMSAAYNPFGETNAQPKQNLFQQQTQPVPSINQLKQSPFPVTMMSADPWAPVNTTANQVRPLTHLNHSSFFAEQCDENMNFEPQRNDEYSAHGRSSASNWYAPSPIPATSSATGHGEYADDGDALFYTAFNEYDHEENVRYLIATGNLNFASAHQMNNNLNNNNTAAANAPWLKPEAAASNPFLS